MKDETIKEKLARLGYKMDFWYEDGHLDAVCVAKWVCKGLVHQKTYTANEIAEVVFSNYLENTTPTSDTGGE